MDSAETAWVAGLLEGEGCFTMSRPNGKRLRMTVSCCMTDRDVIERLHSTVGCGNVYERSPYKEGWKPAWHWVLATRPEVVQLITELRPFMGQRRTARIDELLAANAESPIAFTRYKHGTNSMYRTHGCRCEPCVAWKAEYDQSRRVAHPVVRVPPQHGTHSKYVQGCRCDECKQANTSAQRDYRRKKREQAA